MTEAMLDEVEAALGRAVPAALRRFVRDCPPAEFRRHFGHFYHRAKDMVRSNRFKAARPADNGVREPDGAGGFLPERPWPPGWIAVHDADSEWCTFVRPDHPGVWEWHHDHCEISLVAESLEAMLAASQAEKGMAAPVEVLPHPTLGELSWNPDFRRWTFRHAAPAGKAVLVVLVPGDADCDTFLAAAAGLVPQALAGEPAAFAAARGGVWAEFQEYHGDDTPAGVTAETLRDGLSWDVLSIEAKPGGATAVIYQYGAADALGVDMLLVTADADLRGAGHDWIH